MGEGRTNEPIFNDPIGTPSAIIARHLATLRQRPDLADVHYAVGVEYVRLDRIDAALPYFRQTVALDPRHAKAHSALSDVLMCSGDVDAAAHHARVAHELVPQDLHLAIGLATALDASRQTQGAWEVLDRLLREGHKTIRLAVLQANMSPGGSRDGPALEMIFDLLKSAEPRTPRERCSLHFAAATLLDRLGRYDQAFAHAEHANKLRGASYNPQSVERLTEQFIDFFKRKTLRQIPRATLASETPVLIVGMPRSGSSLVEQVLASHRAVAAAGERDWVFRLWESLVQRFASPTFPLCYSLTRLSTADADQLAAQYLSYLRWIGPHALRVTDKTPANFVHLGLISVLFPSVRVIYCRRDPLDTCLSCFMTDFSTGNDYSFSQESLGHFYRQTERMMSHWQAELDLRILEVQYEQVVSDLEGQARRMVDFLGLPWDERCLRFHQNSRYVPTASSFQVRRPIYQTSVGRSRHYRKHLGPLEASLGMATALI
jgi:tetratricopeptide (TPR) repeat protein